MAFRSDYAKEEDPRLAQWRAADEAETLHGALGFATVIAAVSPKLRADERGEIAAALLAFSPSDCETMYSPSIAGVRYSYTLMLPTCHAVSAQAPKRATLSETPG